VDARSEADRVVLELHGELDLLAAALLQRELDRPETAARSILILDLHDLQFIDSSGLRVILAAQERAEWQGQEFALTRSSAQVERVLEIAGTAKVIRIIAAVDAPLT
jgi:anti-anti-sigma factor